jgi:Nif-specific regulatory protein
MTLIPGLFDSETSAAVVGFPFTAPLVIKPRRLETPAAAVPEIVGTGAAYKMLMAELRRVAPWGVAVVLTGETGTGKTTIAKAIHNLSPRSRQPFVELNCSTVAPDLVESELFGHEKGSFTGAVALKKGLMELADGGTLFLDEIGDMPLSMQVKLLTALETKSFRRVGGDKAISCDIRLVYATNRNLDAMVSAGQFRQDFRARLGSFWLAVPPLRDRREDVPALLAHYLSLFAPQFNRVGAYTVEPGALALLAGCAWPDNVRQLRSVAERLAFDAMDTGAISADDALRVASALGARPLEASASPAPLAPFSGEPTIATSPYLVGEPFEDHCARLLLALCDSLHESGLDHNGVAAALRIYPRSLYDRIKRAKARLGLT